MSHWPKVLLGEALELAYGKALPKTSRSGGGSIPVYGSNGIAGWHDEALVSEPVVIVGRKGGAGAVQITEGPSFPIDTTYFVRARPGYTFDTKFLYYLLRWLDLSRLRTATGVPGLTRDDAYREVMPMPPIGEQLRIVDILSRAESIVRLRRGAQQKAAELVPAIFLDMFGDPGTNPKGWPEVGFEDYLSIQSSVQTPDLVADAELPCIGADSIESGTGRIVSWPTVEDVKPISGKYSFTRNDVLYSKIRPALRKAIVAPDSGYCSADMYPLRPKDGVGTPEYVAALLLSKAFTDYAIGVSARAQMPKVNRETLFAYRHPMPPFRLQEVFASRVKEVNSILGGLDSSFAKSEQVFNTLLGRLFRRD